MFERQLRDGPSRHARPGGAKMLGERRQAEQPALLRGKQGRGSRRALIPGDKTLRQEPDRVREGRGCHQTVDVSRLHRQGGVSSSSLVPSFIAAASINIHRPQRHPRGWITGSNGLRPEDRVGAR